MDLKDIGWGPFFAAGLADCERPEWQPARVVVEHRGGYLVWGPWGERPASLSGRFRHQAQASGDFPAVGDWVAGEFRGGEDRFVIQHLLPRRTKFSRTEAGRSRGEQVVAANIDDVLLVAALDASPNVRRLERTLVLAWESGAEPTVVLTKADLCGDVAGEMAKLEEVLKGVSIYAVSAATGQGLEALDSILRPGRTLALLGPSGVGKSTLINQWSGEEILDTQEVREKDLKGRHTTTHRQLVQLPAGALVIDTPGMRELQLWEGEEGLGDTFEDLHTLAAGCRFRDCRHEEEPGCAVRQAVDEGRLDAGRLHNYHKLLRELAHFERHYDKRAQLEERVRVKSLTKHLRATLKQKGRK